MHKNIDINDNINDNIIENNNDISNNYIFTHPLKSTNSNTYMNVSKNIVSDLDLNSNDTITLYDVILNNISNIKNIPQHKIIKTQSQERVYSEITNNYFTDKKDIERNQTLIKIIGSSINHNLLDKTIQQQEIIENELFSKKMNSEFFDNYNYIEYKPLYFVNRSSKIMSFLNLYTLSSPLISLLTPLLILLIPFVTLRVKGYDINFSNYFKFLQEILKKVPAFRIFSFDSNTSFNAKISAFIGLLFYFIQMYYNTKYCIRYTHKNHDIHKFIVILKNITNNSYEILNTLINKINDTEELFNKDITISNFLNNIHIHINTLQSLKDKLSKYDTNYKVLSITHINTIGEKLKLYYELVSDYKNIKNKLKSIFDINTFCYYYKNIHINIQNNYINFCTTNTTDTTTKTNDKTIITKFSKLYFPMLLFNKGDDTNITYNSISLGKSLILSGPNASGKTTLLKSILFNILCNQQFGCGFYNTCELNNCFSVIESYINILDTHDRNSLFQNEAIRMLEIISKVNKDNTSKDDKDYCNKHMFFVFDELFSGTNQQEANACGISCLKELLEHKNVRFCLTTHYEGICKYFMQKRYSKIVSNEQMECDYNNEDKNKITYNYKIKKGISKIYGGLNVLKDLRYPDKIINNAKCLLFNIQ